MPRDDSYKGIVVINMSECDRFARKREGYESISAATTAEVRTSNTINHACTLSKLSFPIIFAFLLGVSARCITLYFANALSEREGSTSIFAGISLAITYVNGNFIYAIRIHRLIVYVE